MNTRFMCNLCGQQPCMCVVVECRACDGFGPPDCAECNGDGWIKCNGPDAGGRCRFAHCYCEAAWERQQEDIASEPPMSARERHERAWRQKRELRR